MHSSVTERFKNKIVLQSQIYSSATYHHTRWFRLLSGPKALLKYPPKTVISITCRVDFVPSNRRPPKTTKTKYKWKNKKKKPTTTPRQQMQLNDFTRSCPVPIPGHNNVVRTKIKKIRCPYKRAHCTRAACLSGGGGKGKNAIIRVQMHNMSTWLETAGGSRTSLCFSNNFPETVHST